MRFNAQSPSLLSPPSALLLSLLLPFAALLAGADTYARRPASRRSGSGTAAGRMSEAVDRAIEATKRRQPADYSAQAQRQRGSNLGPDAGNRGPGGSRLSKPSGKAHQSTTHTLDVERLNRLIKAIDATWTLPKRTAKKEPIGSNFQFKKTCASIFKARTNACQQLGFGVMCFNFCYEQGEKLTLKCEDLSDAYFCKSNAQFADLLAKYHKDAYRAKSYIHQMMSRCYATAICDGDALLNATRAITGREGADGDAPRSPPPSSGAGGATVMPNRWRKLGGAPNIRQRPIKISGNADRGRRVNERDEPRANEIGDGGGDDNSNNDSNGDTLEVVTPKYVPFWQRLLVGKRARGATTPVPPPAPKRPTVGRSYKSAQWQHANRAEDDFSEAPPRTAAEAIRRRQRQLNALRGLDGKIAVLPRKPHDERDEFTVAEWAENRIDSMPRGDPDWATRSGIWRRSEKREERDRSSLSDESDTSDTVEDRTALRPEHGVQPPQFHGGGDSTTEGATNAWTHARGREAPFPQRSIEREHPTGASGETAPPPPWPPAHKRERLAAGGALVGFWNQFRPGEWFRSIHYFTNTG